MIKPTALIHTDALRREYPANWVLAKSLEAAGYNVILSSRSSTQRLLRFFTPDVVILSHVFSLSENELASLHRRGARIFSNEVEGEIEGNQLGISGTYPKEIAYQYFEKIFTWSSWSASWLVKERQVDPARVSATGSVRLSLLRHFKSRPERHRIGILSRFEIINTFDGRHPFDNLMSMDVRDARGRAYLERTVVEMESFAITCQVIESLVSKGIAVSIRPHPNEGIEAYQLLQKKYGPLLDVDSSTDYMGWLERLSTVVGTLSSAYTEPYLLGIPIVSIDALQESNYQSAHMNPFMATFSQACHRPRDLPELLEMCANQQLAAIKNPQLQQQLSAIYSLSNQVDPIEKVVLEVGHAASSAHKLSGVFAEPAKLLLDVLSIVSCIWKKSPKLALRTHQIYNYNSLLHSPSSFMRGIGSAETNRPAQGQISVP
jgi:surface carbohydrate biosynthesis protein